MDHNIFLAINSLANRSLILDKIGLFFGGDYFLYLFFGGAILLWLVPTLRTRVYIMVGAVLVSRGIITEIIKRIISRSRPYEILNVHQLLADHDTGVSFPSGHATIYFAIAFAFWGTRYFWPFFILACLGSMARVFVGVHYPLDILVGAIIGTLTSWILLRLFKTRILG